MALSNLGGTQAELTWGAAVVEVLAVYSRLALTGMALAISFYACV